MCVNEARRVCLLILWLISSTQLPQDGEGDTEVLLWFHWRSCIILPSTFLQVRKWRSFVQLRLGCLLETEASWDDWNSIDSPHTLSVPGFVRKGKYRKPKFSIEFPGAVMGVLKSLSVAEPTSYSQSVFLSTPILVFHLCRNWVLRRDVDENPRLLERNQVNTGTFLLTKTWLFALVYTWPVSQWVIINESMCGAKGQGT